MARIYLIRHGQASFGKENYDQLSELGERQASHLGSVISQRLPQFDAVYLGTLQRHKQTAENCLASFPNGLEDSKPIYDAGWNEYDHQGILAASRSEFKTAASMTEYLAEQENPKKAFEDAFVKAMQRWMAGDNDADYAEPWQGFTTRVHGALKQLLIDNHNAKDIAVFTSGGPISLLSQAFLGVPQENIMHLNWTLLNCGITKLVATDSRIFVASLNEHTHFEGVQNSKYITYT